MCQNKIETACPIIQMLLDERKEEEEKLKFQGTRVTVENFLAWKKKFDAEMVERDFEKLKLANETAAEKEVIKIQPASKLKWSNVIMVADTCRKAGFKNVSFVEPPGFNISVVN